MGGRIKYVPKPGAKPAGNGGGESGVGGRKTRDGKPPTTSDSRPTAAKPRERIDATYLAAARELRDRYLERVNGSADALPAPMARYDVSRILPAMSAVESPAMSAIESGIVEGRRGLPAAAALASPAPAGAAMPIGARARRRLPSAAA